MAKKHTLLQTISRHAGPVQEICSRYGNRPETLIEILHDVQACIGHVPEDTLPVIANALNLSRAEVYGVATFYHDFHLKPTGKHHLKLCSAEACQSMGARGLVAAVEKFLNVKMGQTTADGLITLEATYCLGLCASAPSMMIDHRPIARVNVEKVKSIVEGIRA